MVQEYFLTESRNPVCIPTYPSVYDLAETALIRIKKMIFQQLILFVDISSFSSGIFTLQFLQIYIFQLA